MQGHQRPDISDKEMSDKINSDQQKVLKELVEKFFAGVNAAKDNSVVLKEKLETIRDFVKENF